MQLVLKLPTGAQIDPTGSSTGSHHVLRGGSYGTLEYFCTVFVRNSFGFRLVRAVLPEAGASPGT